MIRGGKRLNLSGGRLASELGIRQDARRGLLAAGAVLRNKWGGEVLRRPGTGRVYKRGNVSHRASAPGEPPATNTGRLANSIDIEAIPELTDPTIRVGTGLDYGRHLQYGVPGRIEPRPHGDVALAEAERDMNAAFRRAMK